MLRERNRNYSDFPENARGLDYLCVVMLLKHLFRTVGADSNVIIFSALPYRLRKYTIWEVTEGKRGQAGMGIHYCSGGKNMVSWPSFSVDNNNGICVRLRLMQVVRREKVRRL